MITKRMDKSLIYILILVATSLLLPFCFFAQKVGVNPDLATLTYIGGLLVGIVIMMTYNWLGHRSHQIWMTWHNNEKWPNSAPEVCVNPLKLHVLAYTLLVIMAAIIYPVRLFAPGAKVLFIPLVYWLGVILGTSFVWTAAWYYLQDNMSDNCPAR